MSDGQERHQPRLRNIIDRVVERAEVYVEHGLEIVESGLELLEDGWERAEDYAESLSLRREITAGISMQDNTLSRPVVRRVAKFAALEQILLRHRRTQDRIDTLQQDHTDSITTNHERAAFEGDTGQTEELIGSEWKAITMLVQIYSRNNPDNLSIHENVIPLLRRASVLDASTEIM